MMTRLCQQLKRSRWGKTKVVVFSKTIVPIVFTVESRVRHTAAARSDKTDVQYLCRTVYLKTSRNLSFHQILRHGSIEFDGSL